MGNMNTKKAEDRDTAGNLEEISLGCVCEESAFTFNLDN